jgi:hypothetical protein
MTLFYSIWENWVVVLRWLAWVILETFIQSSCYIPSAYLLPMDVQIRCLSLLSLAREGVIALNVFNPLCSPNLPVDV